MMAFDGMDGRLIMRELEEGLRRQLARRGDILRVVPKAGWVALRSGRLRRTFAEVRLRRRHLEVYILPSPGELGVEGRGVTAVPPSRGWGWFRGRLLVRPGETAAASRALVQSYLFLARRPRIYRERP